MEINKVIKDINIPPLKSKTKDSLEDIDSKRPFSKNVIQRHPQLGVDVIFKDNDSLKSEWDTTTKINKILSTSLSDYLRRDLKKRIKERIVTEGGDEKLGNIRFDGHLEEIYDSILEEPEMQKRLLNSNLEKEDRSEMHFH